MALFILCALSLIVPDLVLGKASLVDCGGEYKKVTIKSGSVSPDPIQYPGNVSLTVSLDVLEDLPASNFKMQIRLTKLEPRRMKVPCLDGFGSCDYDVCDMIQSHKDIFCPMFPAGSECKCPMKANSYEIKNAPVALPDFGEIFVQILKGRYEGNITLVDTVSNHELACIAMKFEIVPSK